VYLLFELQELLEKHKGDEDALLMMRAKLWKLIEQYS